MLVLAEVVCYEATEDDTHAALDAASARLAASAARAGDVPVRFKVLAGPPGETLRRFAEEQDMDLLVVGRRGRGGGSCSPVGGVIPVGGGGLGAVCAQ